MTSLSANSFDCLPMWAYYTNNCEGFCVEYEVLNPQLILPVGYEPKRISLASIIADFYSEFHKMQENGEKTNPEVEFYATLLKQQLYLKHESWKAEKEFRIIYPISSGLGKNINISVLGLKTNRICAGYNYSSEHKDKLKEICSVLAQFHPNLASYSNITGGIDRLVFRKTGTECVCYGIDRYFTAYLSAKAGKSQAKVSTLCYWGRYFCRFAKVFRWNCCFFRKARAFKPIAFLSHLKNGETQITLLLLSN